MDESNLKGGKTMNAVKNENYSPEQISDAEKILEVYAKLPDNKKNC